MTGAAETNSETNSEGHFETTFESHGLSFRLTSPRAAVVEAFADLLIDLHATGGADHTERAMRDHTIRLDPVVDPVVDPTTTLFRVAFDGRSVHEALVEGSLISHVLMELNTRIARAVWSAGSIPIHASTASGAGGAVVLAGGSHSGKSTLATALSLTGAGAGFLADEITALEPDRLVALPYGKPAALRPPALDLLAPKVPRLRHPGSRFEHDERFVPPSELGIRPTTPPRVAAIVFPRYVFPGAVPPGAVSPGSVGSVDPGLVEVRPGEALTRLMRLTLAHESVDASTFRVLERLVRDVPAYDLAYTDALAAADILRPVLGTGVGANVGTGDRRGGAT